MSAMMIEHRKEIGDNNRVAHAGGDCAAAPSFRFAIGDVVKVAAASPAYTVVERSYVEAADMTRRLYLCISVDGTVASFAEHLLQRLRRAPQAATQAAPRDDYNGGTARPGDEVVMVPNPRRYSKRLVDAARNVLTHGLLVSGPGAQARGELLLQLASDIVAAHDADTIDASNAAGETAPPVTETSPQAPQADPLAPYRGPCIACAENVHRYKVGSTFMHTRGVAEPGVTGNRYRSVICGDQDGIGPVVDREQALRSAVREAHRMGVERAAAGLPTIVPMRE